METDHEIFCIVIFLLPLIPEGQLSVTCESMSTEYWFTDYEIQACPGSEVIKLFSCSIQLSMKFFRLINVKMPTIVGILTFMSRKNSIPGLSEPKEAEFLDIFILMSI